MLDIWNGLILALGSIVGHLWALVFRLIGTLVIAALSLLPVVSLGELDLSPVLSQIDFAGWFLPYAALGVIFVQWVALVGFSVATFFFRLGAKVAAVARGGAW